MAMAMIELDVEDTPHSLASQPVPKICAGIISFDAETSIKLSTICNQWSTSDSVKTYDSALQITWP